MKTQKDVTLNVILTEITLSLNRLKSKINVTATFNRSTFHLKIEFGAKCNVIALETVKTMDTQKI